MKKLIKSTQVYYGNAFTPVDIFIVDGVVANVAPIIVPDSETEVIRAGNSYVLPGLADAHVHFREPGYSYKETIRTGSEAAARSGYTDVCTMPNVLPVPDSVENLKKQLEIIERDAIVNIHPYGSITVGEKGKQLSDMEALAPYVVAFSDDGHGVQDEEMMLEAMTTAKRLGKIIAAHCEDDSLLNGGYIHNGNYAAEHGHKGISSASEYLQLERDLKLAAKTGCSYHACHISTKESVDLIRKAKAAGIDVTCETAPHYLLLSQDRLQDDGCFKVNPPIREQADRLALIEGIVDGTIDMIATDHAPHSVEEKSHGLEGSASGIVGLETALPLLHTFFTRFQYKISPEKLIELMAINPSKRFGFNNQIIMGKAANLSMFSFEDSYKIDPQTFSSKGRSTPFEGQTVYGKCTLTVCNGRIVWRDSSIEK